MSHPSKQFRHRNAQSLLHGPSTLLQAPYHNRTVSGPYASLAIRSCVLERFLAADQENLVKLAEVLDDIRAPGKLVIRLNIDIEALVRGT